MFERFTDRARRVVVLAQEEARELGHGYIGTEHILLGLIREREGVAARSLESLGLSLDAVREQVQVTVGTGTGMPAGHIPFTPRAKKVLELSLREALQLGHNYIGTEHILLGLIREGDGVAAVVLVSLGADLNRVRQQVIQVLHHTGAETGEASEAGETGEEVARRTRTTHYLSRSGSAGSTARPVPAPPLAVLAARIDEMAGKLDAIADRLASIENLLAASRRPVARPPRQPPAPGRPPVARKPKQPPAPPPGGEPPGPPAQPPAEEPPAEQPPDSGTEPQG